MAFKFHHSLAVRAAFNYGRLVGDDLTADPNSMEDEARYYRNLSFRNDIKELSVGLEIYLLPNYGGPQNRLPINGYVFLGVAFFHHEPTAFVPDLEFQTDFNNGTPVDQAGGWVNLRKLGTEEQNFGEGKKYSPIQFAIPIALGAELSLSSSISIGLELGFRKLFFDHLDDGGSYADLDKFTDPTARVLSDRSLEPTSAWKGDARTIPSNHPNLNTFDSGQSYWVSGFLGSGVSTYNNGTSSVRGNPADGDTYFITQIKVTYIFGDSGSRSKFK